MKTAAKTSKIKREPQSKITGTYAYDADSGKIVKVSDCVPKIASHGGTSFDAAAAGPCGRQACAGGRCAGQGGDDF